MQHAHFPSSFTIYLLLTQLKNKNTRGKGRKGT